MAYSVLMPSLHGSGEWGGVDFSCLVLKVFVLSLKIVVKVMEQPEGLPVSYVGTVLKDFVWNKCVIKQLEARGAISKVRSSVLVS